MNRNHSKTTTLKSGQRKGPPKKQSNIRTMNLYYEKYFLSDLPIIAVFILYFVYLFIFWREVCRVQVVYVVYCRSVAAFYSMLHSYWPNPYISSLRFQSYVCTAGRCSQAVHSTYTCTHTAESVVQLRTSSLGSRLVTALLPRSSEKS